MSRRKQAKPRLWKREEEEEEDENLEQISINTTCESGSLNCKEEASDLEDEDRIPFVAVSTTQPKTENVGLESGEENDLKEDNCTEDNFEHYSREYLSRNSELKNDDQFEQYLQDDENSLDSDTLGTEGGSSWVSEDHTTSPGSSCPTPNSTTEVADSELSFTVGVTEGTPHACRFCDKAFPRNSYLRRHEQTHTDCMPFQCQYCNTLFKHKRSRDRHIKIHTGEKKYKCSKCDAGYTRSDHLKIHLKTHDNRKPFQCTLCNRGYGTAAALTSHMQNHKRSNEISSQPAPAGSIKCHKCSETFREPEELQNHMNLHQSPENVHNSNNKSSKNSYPTILICPYCRKDNFSTMEALQSHVQSAHKSIFNGDLQREISNLKLRSPAPTPSQLNSSSPLNVTQSFNSLPSYYCDQCTMKFSSLQALQKHTSAVHGFSANTYNNLKYLMSPEMYNNGKLYCMFCAMQFLTPAAYAEHYIIFHGPYHPQLMALTPPEQMKPTDLSKKTSPVKRPNIDEHRASPRKKSKVNENSILNSNNHRYGYPGPLLCNQCSAAFTDFESFRAHIKLHIEETSGGLLGGASPMERKRASAEFTCPHCRSVFSSNEEISQHIVTHFLASSVEYSCENCQKSYDKGDDLQKHLMEVHAHHLYSCSICNEVFDSKMAIQVHFTIRHSNEAKVYRCTGCSSSNAAFHSEMEFANHVKTMHTNNSPLLAAFATHHHNTQMLRCFICHMTFPTELEMQLHLPTHGKQFQCTLCPQSFHIEYLLDKHMQNDHSTPQINGSLENCLDSNNKESSPILSPNNRFDNQMKKNEGSESKSNFICCDICEKCDFSNDNELLNHKKLFHHKLLSPVKHESSENSEDRLKLSQKHKSNSSSSSPTIRCDNKKMESFNGDSNGSNLTCCEICEKRDFANEAELMSHKKLIHNVKLSPHGKVSLNCAYCKENCKSRSDLENHMKTHSQNSTSSGKHKCIICDEMCPTAAVLAEHKLTHCKVLSGKTCMQCKGSITTEEQFFSHIQQHSSPQNGTNNNNNSSQNSLVLPTFCVICRQTLSSEMEARMHARFHLHQSADLVPCSVCFHMSERQDLIAGICKECYQRHGKSSPFRCPECHMKFDNGPAIEIHLATVHRKSYQCIKCQVSFDNEKEIQHHVASHVMIDGLNGHECRLCRSVFTTAQGLQTHILEHGLAARPYDCSRCKQKFFFTSELEHHSYVHLEEMALSEGHGYFYGQEKNLLKDKSANIPYINHSISLAENLYNNNKEPGNKYHCTECGIDFPHANDLYDHKNRAHNNQNDRYVQNGEHKRKRETPNPTEANRVKYEEQNDNVDVDEKMDAKQNDCESEDEQIDVVTTKTEEQAENIEKNDKQ
ncbi:zinc finger protein 423 homolog isoform X2 [Planococcus citri]|uniref:zinc finger protein 423 homolog isoform X2 n=1 Tax=Planococcus citri TaxID=170843 RepID=UPI0031F8D133